MSMYGEDDYIAALSFAGPPPEYYVQVPTRAAEVTKRREWFELVEVFCENWFAGKPIDGQWANFGPSFEQWYIRRQHV